MLPPPLLPFFQVSKLNYVTWRKQWVVPYSSKSSMNISNHILSNEVPRILYHFHHSLCVPKDFMSASVRSHHILWQRCDARPKDVTVARGLVQQCTQGLNDAIHPWSTYQLVAKPTTICSQQGGQLQKAVFCKWKKNLTIHPIRSNSLKYLWFIYFQYSTTWLTATVQCPGRTGI